LRTIHQKLSLNQKKPSKDKATTQKGGPKKKGRIEPPELPPSEDTLLALNGLCPKSGAIEIKKVFSDTISHRNNLRLTSDLRILQLYPKFKECGFLVSILYIFSFIIFYHFQINYEFELMHEEECSFFLEKWPRTAATILKEAKAINKSPALAKFLSSEAGKQIY
jgi:hypothetical protein